MKFTILIRSMSVIGCCLSVLLKLSRVSLWEKNYVLGILFKSLLVGGTQLAVFKFIENASSLVINSVLLSCISIPYL